MVKALRYWLQAVGLTEEPPRGRRMQQFTRLGEIIYQHDTYIEELWYALPFAVLSCLTRR
ncbi:MAG: DUF4007 family protein [Oscillospiraceae bacterium]